MQDSFDLILIGKSFMLLITLTYFIFFLQVILKIHLDINIRRYFRQTNWKICYNATIDIVHVKFIIVTTMFHHHHHYIYYYWGHTTNVENKCATNRNDPTIVNYAYPALPRYNVLSKKWHQWYRSVTMHARKENSSSFEKIKGTKQNLN